MAHETVAARPDCCPELLRRRSEEAVSASIHHAALAQQYLTLAQKFTALAEHVAGGVDGLQQVAVQLEREACAPEAVPALVPPVRSVSQPAVTVAAGPRRIFAEAMLQPSVAGTGGEFHAPPARVPLDELSRAEQRMRAAVARTEAGLPP
ncbi:MAG: hypothetical protein ACKPHU_31220, partial [Planctomycetaceae bacterium]